MSDNPNKISVNTWEFPEGVINQEIVTGGKPMFESIMDKWMKMILDTREAGIREMLVKMGWTPPKEEVPISGDYLDRVRKQADDATGIPVKPDHIQRLESIGRKIHRIRNHIHDLRIRLEKVDTLGYWTPELIDITAQLWAIAQKDCNGRAP